MTLCCSPVSAALAAMLLLCTGCAASAKQTTNQSGPYNEAGPPSTAVGSPVPGTIPGVTLPVAQTAALPPSSKAAARALNG